MKKAPSKKETREIYDCCYHHSGRSIVIGFMLLVIGLMLENGYSISDIMVLTGGIFIVKGILAMLFKKNKYKL